jgi:hypothetical protein
MALFLSTECKRLLLYPVLADSISTSAKMAPFEWTSSEIDKYSWIWLQFLDAAQYVFRLHLSNQTA